MQRRSEAVYIPPQDENRLEIIVRMLRLRSLQTEQYPEKKREQGVILSRLSPPEYYQADAHQHNGGSRQLQSQGLEALFPAP